MHATDHADGDKRETETVNIHDNAHYSHLHCGECRGAPLMQPVKDEAKIRCVRCGTEVKADDYDRLMAEHVGESEESGCNGNAVTVFHRRRTGTEEEIREAVHAHHEVGRGREDLTAEAFAEHYFAAETVLGTMDLDEAWHRAQGRMVNEECNARHMVSSAQVGDVFLVHHEDGTHSYHVVEGVGFREAEALNE